MSKTCNKCGQKIKLAHKETLNKKLLQGLQAAARIVIETNRNDIDLHTLIDDYNIYNNFQKLRYFGLAYYLKDAKGQRVRGHWIITKRGWQFLRGEIKISKWVKVLENHITERSIDTVNVRDIYRGSDVVVTTFEYFDENNNPVGYKPTIPTDKQLELI